MKKVRTFLLLILIMFTFNGCLLLTFTSTAVTILTTSQEVEEDYEGDFIDYVEDTVEETYDFLAEQVEN